VAGAGEGRKRPNRPTNCHKGTILRTATKALFGALVGGAFLKIRCSAPRASTDVNGRTLLDHGVSRPISPYHGVSLLAHPPTLQCVSKARGWTSHVVRWLVLSLLLTAIAGVRV
jgi:hypothetical protein